MKWWRARSKRTQILRILVTILAIAAFLLLLGGSADAWLQFSGEIPGAALAVGGAFWIGLRTARHEAELARAHASEAYEGEQRQREGELRRALLREIELNLVLLDKAREHAQFGRIQKVAWEAAIALPHKERLLHQKLQLADADGSIYDTSISLMPPAESQDHRTPWVSATKAHADTAWRSFETAGRYLAKALGVQDRRAPTARVPVTGSG